MSQTLAGNWLLLMLCAALDALISAIYLAMRTTDGPIAFHSWGGTIVLLGKLALAAGIATVAAGLVRAASGRSWLLVLNGTALAALGMIQYDLAARYPIRFLTVALLIIAMAVSAGILDLEVARTLRRANESTDARLAFAAGAASIGFAVVFLALGLRWIPVEPGSHTDLLWLGLYFAFGAVSTLWLAVRLRGHYGSTRAEQPA